MTSDVMMRTKARIGSQMPALGVHGEEDRPADADGQGQDAEPSVDGGGGALGDVDPGSLVPDGCGVDR